MKKAKVERAVFYKRTGSSTEPIGSAEWITWCETTHGGKEYLHGSGNAELNVDTVFLGIDHQMSDGPPLLFLTRIKGGPRDRKAWLSASTAEAERRHQEACEIAGIESPPRFRLV